MKTLLCAVSHGLYHPWVQILKEGQERTWLTNPVPNNLEIVHYHATPVNSFLQRVDKFHEQIRWSNKYLSSFLKFTDNLLLGSLIDYIPRIQESELLQSKKRVLHILFPDTYLTYRWKLLSLMKFFIENTSHDFLLTTTTASYINLPALSRKLNDFENNDLYFGALPYTGATFVSGSNRLLSRKTVESILNSKRRFSIGIIEDVALGKLLYNLGILPTFIPIINVPTIEALKGLSNDALKTNYHFRLKSGSNENRGDVELMRELHFRMCLLT